MPTTLKEMHLENASYEDLLKVGQQATIEGETIHQMPFKVQASDIAQAIVAVDAYGQLLRLIKEIQKPSSVGDGFFDDWTFRLIWRCILLNE